MKKVVKTNTFTCDTCGTNEEIEELLDDKSVYPYTKGWCYIYNFAFKLAQERHESGGPHKDKHFCSKKCLVEFVKAFVEVEE